jgi:hypothetical protein
VLTAIKSCVATLRHLFTRWWLSISAGPPTATDEKWAIDQLLPSERELWVQMSAQDRSHAVMVARRFLTLRAGATRAEMAGALLHDVGKIRCDLGTAARVVATVIPPRLIPGFSVCGRWRGRCEVYRDHENLGIGLLLSADSEEATVEMLQGLGSAAGDLAQADHI